MTDRNQEIREGGQEPGAAEILSPKTYTYDEMALIIRQLTLENEMIRLKDSQKHFVTREDLRDELDKLADKLTDKLTDNFNAKFREFKDDFKELKADVAGIKGAFSQFDERLKSFDKTVGLLTKFFAITASAFVVILGAYGGILFNMRGDVSSLMTLREQAAPQGSTAQGSPAEPATPSPLGPAAQTDPAEPATPNPQSPAPSAESVVQSDRAGGPSGTDGSERGG
ncbi:MAG: hypothetical protein LBQ12_03415 [Deltaproteobacteria bacterium]|nr:hypothetical protein [Deltaproteobacteria bacterium]